MLIKLIDLVVIRDVNFANRNEVRRSRDAEFGKSFFEGQLQSIMKKKNKPRK